MADIFGIPVDDIEYQHLENFAHTRPVEGTRLDWKQDIPTSRVTETIAAMVNTLGGLILVGVAEDQRGGAKGMIWPPQNNHGVPPSAADALMSMCHASLQPSDYVPRHRLVPIPHLPGKHVLVVRVDQWAAPAYVWHLDEGFLFRTGDQNRPATPEIVAMLLNPRPVAVQDRLFQEWSMVTSDNNGVVQHLIAVMRYLRPAPEFGTAKKMQLRRAVEMYLSGGAGLAMDPAYDFVSFDHTVAHLDAKLTVWFSALGVARISRSVRTTQAIPLRWLISETALMLHCLQSEQVNTVYPNVRQGEVEFALTNWPVAGIDTTGITQPSDSKPVLGRSVQERQVLSGDGTPWRITRHFIEHVLADAGCLDYERNLTAMEPTIEDALRTYRMQCGRS